MQLMQTQVVSPYCWCHKARLLPAMRAYHWSWTGTGPQLLEELTQSQWVVCCTAVSFFWKGVRMWGGGGAEQGWDLEETYRWA